MSSSDSSFSVQTISVPVRKAQSHKFRVFTFFLLLLSSSLGGSGSTGSSTANGSGGSSTAGADVGQEVLDVLALKSLKKEKSQRKRLSRSRAQIFVPLSHKIVAKRWCSIYLGEEGSPDGLNIDELSSTEEGLDLVGL
jgi:hypothetical protein